MFYNALYAGVFSIIWGWITLKQIGSKMGWVFFKLYFRLKKSTLVLQFLMFNSDKKLTEKKVNNLSDIHSNNNTGCPKKICMIRKSEKNKYLLLK